MTTARDAGAPGDLEEPSSDAVTPTPRWQLALGSVVLVALFASPFWGPPALAHLDFFRVRKVELLGVRYTPAEDVLRRLAVDTTRSVWDPLEPLAARIRTHPQVESVTVTRRLPGTIVVSLVERRPVALAPTPAGLRAFDERGVQLPLDPSRTPVDAPIVTAAPRATAVYHLLGAMQRETPRLYARVSSIRATGADEVVLDVAGLPVRALTTVSLARLSDIEPVERDLARRQLRAAELDLRYRDQVIARLP
ncbi:MAG: ftsQ [Gemmatimonadetes bacterium]|nr:ftsQ [Gemmatimonadota bacterium]